MHDDWDGRRLEDQELSAGTDESNIFTAGVRLQQWEVKDTRHVPTGAEMRREFTKNLGNEGQFAERWEQFQEQAEEVVSKRREVLQRKLDELGDRQDDEAAIDQTHDRKFPAPLR